MAVVSEVGGAGSLGVAFETVMGTYVAPSKFIPIRSESLQVVEDKVYRKNLRGVAEASGAIQGYTHVEGDIEFEVTADTLVYLLYAARVTCTKTGAQAPYTYAFVPANVAKASTATGTSARKTLSIHIERGTQPFAYLGCSVGQLSFTVDGGVLVCTASIIGMSCDTGQAGAAETWPSTTVFGPGDVTLEIPDATARADADTFTAVINDNLQAANRLNGARSSAYQNWGEREVTLSVEADFLALTDYTAYVNQTSQAIELNAVEGAEELHLLFNAAIQDSAPINLAGLGEVNKMSMSYHGIYGTDYSYELTLKTAENIT